MGYFVGKYEYADGSGVEWRYFESMQEAISAVGRHGGHIVKAYGLKAFAEPPPKPKKARRKK